MKILAILFHFPPQYGGAVTLIVDLVNKFAELGHEVTVVTPKLERSSSKFLPKINKNINIVRTAIPPIFASNLKIAGRTCENGLVKKSIELGNKTEFGFIFSVFHPFQWAPKAAISVGKKLKIPVVIKIDDLLHENSQGLKSIQRKIEKIINGKTLRNADIVCVLNDKTKNNLIKIHNVTPEKILMIPNGVDLSLFDSSTHKNPKKLIFSGVMYNYRALDILLNIAPKIIKEVPDVEMIFVGDGPEFNNWKNMSIKKKLEANVKFTGWIDRDELLDIESSAIIGIGPLKLLDITQDSLPIKVMEYATASMAIIAQRGTLHKDILVDGDNGYFVDDANDLACKIILLLKDPIKTKKMGEQSRKMIEKFSLDIVASNIIEAGKKSRMFSA